MSGKYILGRISQNRAKALKYVGSEIALFLTVIILQTSVLSRLQPLGAVPDLCFGALLLISYFCGKEAGAITGIAAGFAVEALGAAGISLLPVLYLLCGYVCGHFTRAIYPKSFVSFLMVLAVGIPARSAITLVYVCMTYGEIHLLEILGKLILPEAFLTLLAACALYFPVKKLCAWMMK